MTLGSPLVYEGAASPRDPMRRSRRFLLGSGQLFEHVEGGREVVRAAHRARELRETVMDAVAGEAEHAREHAVVARPLGAERDEVQAVLLGRPVGDAAAKDLE